MKARTGALVARFHRTVDDETQRRGEPGGSVARARCRRLGATGPPGRGAGLTVTTVGHGCEPLRAAVRVLGAMARRAWDAGGGHMPLPQHRELTVRDRDGPASRVDEAIFLGWLTTGPAPSGHRRHTPNQPPGITALLGRVVLSRRPLPPSVLERLQLPVGTEIGELASRLLMAVHEADGPRCRSYEAALAFVRQSCDAVAEQPPAGPPPSPTLRPP